MARFAIKALVVTALVCLVFDLAASDEGQQQHGQDVHQHQPTPQTDEESQETTTAASSFKTKLKGFANKALETLDALNDKRQEVYDGTKKIVKGVVDKVKTTFGKGGSEEDEPRSPESSSEEHKTQMKSEKLN